MTIELTAEAVTDAKAFAQPERLYELFSRLRRESPVTRVETEAFPSFWLITRHEDIKAIELAPETFLSGPRAILLTKAQEQTNIQYFGDRNGLKTLVHMDGEEHKKHRKITQSFFSRGNIEKLRQGMVAQADAYIDKMAAMGGKCDFATEIAFRYPLRVLMSILGVPPEDDDHMLKLTQGLLAYYDPELAYSHDMGEMALVKVVGDFAEYANALIAKRRAEPTDDLASVLASATIDGEPIDAFNQLSYFIIVATAGHDTTSATIAEGVNALIENPGLLERLKAEPELCVNASEEFARLATPGKHFLRTAAKDVEIAGVKIAKGDTLLLSLASASRDDAVFENPHRVTLDRWPNPHLSFGAGPHACLGKNLARLETEIFFNRLLPRVQSIERAGPIEYVESFFVSGIKRLPIAYKMT
ncbi:MAG: cytochrome P450 [Parvularculaceae bacterium]